MRIDGVGWPVSFSFFLFGVVRFLLFCFFLVVGQLFSYCVVMPRKMTKTQDLTKHHTNKQTMCAHPYGQQRNAKNSTSPPRGGSGHVGKVGRMRTQENGVLLFNEKF